MSKKQVNQIVVPVRTQETVMDVLQAVDVNHCVLVNFTDSPINDAKAWYRQAKAVSSIVTLNLKANAKGVLDSLLEAADGKGEYAGMAIVIAQNGRYKVPKQVYHLAQSEQTKAKHPEVEDYMDYKCLVSELGEALGKELNYEEFSAYRTAEVLKNVEADLTEVFNKYFTDLAKAKLEKENARLKLAQKERAMKAERTKIYNTQTGSFMSYSMQREQNDPSNWFFTEELETMALSELLRAIVKEYNLDYVTTRHLVKHYDFSTILQLNFLNDFSQSKDFKRIYKVDKELYVNTASLVIEEDNELGDTVKTIKGYRCLQTGVILDKLPNGAVEFINVAHGASGIRKNASFYLVEDGKVESILDRASRGIYGRAKGKFMNISKTVKANTRIMASAAPSQVLYQLDCFAFYVGKFGTGDKKSLIKKFEGLKGAMDGTAFTLFRAMQARLGSSKVFASQVTRRLMQLMIRFFDAAPIILEIGKEETEEQKAIMKAIFDSEDHQAMINGEMVDLTGRVVICRKAGSNAVIPEYFTDLNGYKANFDLTKGFEIPVLDMPMPNSANSSTQFLSKVIAAGGKKAVKLIINRLKSHFDGLLDGLTADGELKIKDVTDPFIKGLIGRSCPEYMKLDASVRRQNISLVLNAIAKSLNRMRFPIPMSANGRAIPDIGVLFGMPILKDAEIYTVDIKGGTETIVIKYPTIGEKEFWKAQVASYKTICERIEQFEIPDALKGFGNDFKTELKLYFRNFTAGCTMMPGNKALMAGLAGMDYDYDMVIVIFDPEFVAIFKETKQGVIHIMNDGEDMTEKKVFDYTIMSDPQLALIAKDAANVGGVTNNYNIPMQFDLYCRYYEEMTQDLYMECIDAQMAGNTTVAEGIAARIAKRAHSRNLFIEQFGKLIDYSLLDSVTAAGILKKRKSLNFPAYDFKGQAPRINSLQQALASISDRTEGAAYEPIGESWDDPLYVYMPVSKAQKEHAEKQLKTCRIANLEDIRMICADINRIARSDQETTIDSAKTSITANIVLNFSVFFNVFSKVEYVYGIDRETNGITREVKRPNGDFGMLGKKFYLYDVFSLVRDEVEAYAIPKMQAFLDSYEYSEEELANLLPSYEGVKGVAACMNIASLYGHIAYNNVQNPDDVSKEMIAKYYQALHYMTKYAVQDTPINKSANSFGCFVTWLSYYGNGTNGRTAKRAQKTGFNLNVFPIETLYFAHKLTNKMARVCEPVTCIESEIKENAFLEFVNGDAYNEEGRLIAVAKEAVNGEFKIMKVNDKLMACDRLSHYLDREAYNRSYVAFSLKGCHENLKGAVTFDAAQRGVYSSRDGAKVVINGMIYDSPMYEAVKLIKGMNKELTVEDSYVMDKDGMETTIVLAKIGDAIEVIEDKVVAAYVADEAYAYSDEEAAEIMDFNPADYGYDYNELTTLEYDDSVVIDFEE